MKQYRIHVLLFISLYFIKLPSAIISSWNYADLGPDVWSDQYPLCIGEFQSPINIRTACTTYQSFQPFNFSEDFYDSHNFTLINNGHTILATYTGNILPSFTLTDGGLNGTFQFVNFHLHWGENYKSGSEHQM
jgi:carbonic anhydrase